MPKDDKKLLRVFDELAKISAIALQESKRN